MLHKIGFIGTGVMGSSMAKHLLSKGHELFVYNRTQSKTSDLLSLGATLLPPHEIAQKCSIIILMLGYPQDVRSLTLGSQGIIRLMKKNSILIDHTTSSP